MTTPRHARDELATVTIDLADIGEGMVDSVGGKADGLAAMIRIGEQVPGGVLPDHEGLPARRNPAAGGARGLPFARRRAGRGPLQRDRAGLARGQLCRSTRHLSQRERRRRAAVCASADQDACRDEGSAAAVGAVAGLRAERAFSIFVSWCRLQSSAKPPPGSAAAPWSD